VKNLLLAFLLFIPCHAFGDDFIQTTFLGDVEKINKHLKNGVDINFQNEDGLTSLMIASYYGNNIIVQLLCEKGAAINLQNHDGYTALMYAASCNKYEAVKLLLAKGAKVNIQNHDGWTALMHAIAFEGSDETVELLCENGADLELESDGGYTAMAHAQSRDNEMIIETLRKAGAIR